MLAAIVSPILALVILLQNTKVFEFVYVTRSNLIVVDKLRTRLCPVFPPENIFLNTGYASAPDPVPLILILGVEVYPSPGSVITIAPMPPEPFNVA